MIAGNNESGDDDAGLPKPGDLLGGKFRIQGLIGRGGMGAVFAAQHEMLGQRVAIKMLLSTVVSSREAVTRFLNEARAAALIEGEHVARVMDVATLDDGRPYMVIEYLEGSDLSQVLEARGPLPISEAVDYILQSLEALAQAHARGLVHRDFKPSNLFLARRQDGTTLVKVLDFGIAKATQPQTFEDGSNVTRSGVVLGSPLYMSPEQLRNPRTVDARSDIWAVGLTLYELLVGAPPFSGTTFGEVFAAILEQPAPPVRSERPEIDPALNAIIARCLNRDVNQRFSNVADLAQELARHGSPRAIFSLERIVSVLPPPPVAALAATHAAGDGSHAQTAALARAVTPYGVAGSKPPGIADGTAPPLSSTRMPAVVAKAPASSPKRAAAIWAGVGAALVVGGLLGAWGLRPWGRSGSTAGASASSMTVPSAVAPPPHAQDSLDAQGAPTEPASLSPVAEPAPSRGPVLHVGQAASAPGSHANPDASREPVPLKSKTRVDQNGLAGENPFR